MRHLSLVMAATALVFAASGSFAADTSAPPAAMPAATAPAPAAMTATAATPAPAVNTVPAEDPNAIVCRRLAPETGTRLGSRTQCRTNAEWNEISRQAQEGMRMEMQKGTSGPSGH